MTEARADNARSWGGTPTPYEAWVRRQGVPVLEGYGITDLSEPNFGYLDERVQQVLGRLNGLIASLSASPSRPASSRIASLVQPTP